MSVSWTVLCQQCSRLQVSSLMHGQHSELCSSCLMRAWQLFGAPSLAQEFVSSATQQQCTLACSERLNAVVQFYL